MYGSSYVNLINQVFLVYDSFYRYFSSNPPNNPLFLQTLAQRILIVYIAFIVLIKTI